MNNDCLRSKNVSAPCQTCGERLELCHVTPWGFYCGACCPVCHRAPDAEQREAAESA
jgi:hypothetical protein